MTLQEPSSPLFAADELQILEVQPSWSQDELLSQMGLFFLKDVARPLRIHSTQIKHWAREMTDNGESPWALMGVRKVWTQWIIRMSVFAPYYRKQLNSAVRTPEPGWDGNRLLEEEGVFYLTDVCRLLPLKAHQVRYQVRRHPQSREAFGVWKDEIVESYLVDMRKFSAWLREIWKEGKVRRR